jgi:hypothetical protein
MPAWAQVTKNRQAKGILKGNVGKLGKIESGKSKIESNSQPIVFMAAWRLINF